MPASRNGRAILGGIVLAAVQVVPGSLNSRLDGWDQFGVPALLPGFPFQLFACLVAFFLGYGFFRIPGPGESDRVLLFAALRSLVVGVGSAAVAFELLYVLSRPPGTASLGAELQPWPRIVPWAIWASVLPTWLSFLKFSGDGYQARLDRTPQKP